MVRTIFMILFMAMSVVMTILVLMQQGTSYGLGSMGGASSNQDSYWSQNKGRSAEGVLVKVTRVLLIIFLAGAAAMSIGSFQ